MREQDELYADSGAPVQESHGVTRGTALKVGGLGLVGALAGLMPGRAGAVVRKKANNASCAGSGFTCGGPQKHCGYDNYALGACYCATIHYGKIRPAGAPIGACVENTYCYVAAPCNSPRDCGAGYVCTDGGCCFANICQHYCEQGSIGQAPSLKTPKTTAHK